MVKNMYGERAFFGVPLSFLLFIFFSYDPFPRMSRQSHRAINVQKQGSAIYSRDDGLDSTRGAPTVNGGTEDRVQLLGWLL